MHGRVIKHLRESLGLTQHEFARQLTVSQATVSRWEGGQTEPDAEARRRIQSLGRSRVNTGDIALMRMVSSAPALMALLDLGMRVVALSPDCAHTLGLSLREATGVDLRPLFSDNLSHAYDRAADSGFFIGRVAGLDLAVRVRSREGHETPVIGSWHLLPRPSDGEMLLLWHGRSVDEPTFHRARETTGPVRVVTVDEWLAGGDSMKPLTRPGD